MLFRNSIVYPIYIRYHHQLCTRLWLQPIISASYISNLRFIMVDPVFFKEKHSYGKRPVSRWDTHSTCWCSTSLCEITRGYIKSLISTCIGIIDYYSRLMTYSWTHWWHIHVFSQEIPLEKHPHLGCHGPRPERQRRHGVTSWGFILSKIKKHIHLSYLYLSIA